MNALRQALAIARKDALIELRARETLTAMCVFAIMAIVMFNFALRLRVDAVRPLVPGLLWVTLAFMATLGLGRSMSAEQVNQSIDGVLLSVGDRSAIFFGKAIGNTLFTLVVSLFLLPIMAALLDEGALRPALIVPVALGVVGYAGAGTLVGTIAISTRARDVILPVLLLPVTLPLMTAAVLATGAVVDGGGLAEALPWLGVQAGFIVVFWVSGALLYETVLEA